MADFAGRLNIKIHSIGGRCEVEVCSSRPVLASRAFVGKTVAETVKQLPALFTICATAQASACVGACEAAQGFSPAPDVSALRSALVEAETVKEHLWRILLDWPRLLDESPDAGPMRAVMRAHAALQGALAARQVMAPGAELPAVDHAVLDHALAKFGGILVDQVFGSGPGEWLAATRSPADLLAWCRNSSTAAARLLRMVADSGWEALGASAVPPLPALAEEDLGELIGAADADELLRVPSWQGRPAETSTYTRRLQQQLVAALAARFGSGLMARLGARLVELAELHEGLARGCGLLGSPASAPCCAPEKGRDTGCGVAQVPAARGLLVHRVVTDGERIADYRILAPTEWNFHPQGAVTQGLADLPPAEAAVLRLQASLFVTAVDPCVDFDVRILSG